ncbi:type VI secretion system protein ImpK [Caballeronia cordobensis]|uniref:Type VI secretion system protein ImpK n=1 Tax=Caballeronia cordobensis TaxID=1353886 RepID=A0A158IWT8_CABCO|nr:DotU family type IV/VI secretion system protein [Caballeronia cordobensis]SAL61104.1 type VI secretion system protein ImpK [Caballeronia cordobensis]
MNMLTSSHAQAPLVEPTSGAASASASGIRDLLRDTALFVATLSTGGAAGDFEALRARCTSMVADFSAALDRRGYPEDVRDDALKAQCALLDETALQHLSGQDRSNWSAYPLQVQQFNQHDAGERVFERLELRMRERSPQTDLLECYAAILGLGFLGRYALHGANERQTLMAELNALIERLRPQRERSLVIDQPGRRFGDAFRRMSPWAIAAFGCIVALVAWLVWHAVLDAQLAALLPHTVKP